MVNAGASIAKDELSKASDGREEIPFNAIYDEPIKSWKESTDALMKKLFNGEKDSIKILTDLLSDGKMISGKADPSWKEINHTENWNREKNIERAFYAAAIPAAWTANRPAPVVVDFGPSYEINARKYFFEWPESYNSG